MQLAISKSLIRFFCGELEKRGVFALNKYDRKRTDDGTYLVFLFGSTRPTMTSPTSRNLTRHEINVERKESISHHS